MGALARIVGTALAGAVVLPLAVLAGVLVVHAMDSRGAMLVLSASPVGAALGLVIGLVRSIRKRRTHPP